MKQYILSIFYLLILSSSLLAQEDYNIEKIDNRNFPYIKVFIRAKQQLDIHTFSFFENNKPIGYVCDTVEGENYGNGSLSVLFVINQSPKNELLNTLKEEIKGLSKYDKINIAIILDKDSTKNLLHYISPNFSNNHAFFINLLKRKKIQSFIYDFDKNDFKNAKIIEKNINKTQDIYSNKAIICLLDSFKKAEIHSNILTLTKTPVYILLTKQPDSAFQKKLSDICTKSGGIYTISEPSKLKKYLKSYIDDISFNKDLKKTEMLRFIFETSQHKKKNFFKIKYNNNTNQFSFNRPQEYNLSFREQILLMLSGMLLIILFIVTYKNKKSLKKLNAELVPNFKETIPIPVKNIEINVKTKGFNKTYFFEKHIIRIGRSDDNDIIIPDRTVSVAHALINREGNSFVLQDLGSTNGVFLNQKKIKKQELKTNDKIKLGAAILIIRI